MNKSSINSCKNIAISLLRISHQHAAGDFVYVKNLLDNLFEIDKNNQYYLLSNLENKRYFGKRYKTNKNVKIKIIDIRCDFLFHPIRACSKLIAKIKNNNLFKEEILRKEIQKFINKKNVNTLFFPSVIIYPKNIKNVKIISTIFDLQHEYFPENFSEKYLKYRKENYRYAALNSNHIIALSNYTKKTIIEKYKINPNKITAIYLGGPLSGSKPALSAGAKIEKTIPLPANFLFYPAAFWPHKNHKILIDALNKLKYKFLDLSLVFTGIIKKIELKKEIDDLIKNYGLSKKVLFLGYVSDENLNYIYQNANALVFPSSFEGFGLPIVEAFQYKLPVVAANNTSISEIVGDAGLLFETNNLNALIDCIKKVLLNHNLREQLINQGLERVKKFSWINTAKQTLSILEHV